MARTYNPASGANYSASVGKVVYKTGTNTVTLATDIDGHKPCGVIIGAVNATDGPVSVSDIGEKCFAVIDSTATILATTTDTLQLPANQAIYHSVMLQAGFVDDWQSLRWVLHAARTKPAGQSAEHYIAAWINYYQGHLLAHGGDIEGACRHRAAAIDINADNRYEYMFPLAYGELALWQTLTGDVTGAHVTADTALADARRTNIRFVNGFALLVVGVCHLLWGDAARAELGSAVE